MLPELPEHVHAELLQPCIGDGVKVNALMQRVNLNGILAVEGNVLFNIGYPQPPEAIGFPVMSMLFFLSNNRMKWLIILLSKHPPPT